MGVVILVLWKFVRNSLYFLQFILAFVQEPFLHFGCHECTVGLLYFIICQRCSIDVFHVSGEQLEVLLCFLAEGVLRLQTGVLVKQFDDMFSIILDATDTVSRLLIWFPLTLHLVPAVPQLRLYLPIELIDGS